MVMPKLKIIYSQILRGKNKSKFPFCCIGSITAMTSIFCSICAKSSSNTCRGLLPSFFRVSWPDNLSPPGNSIRSKQFHAYSKIRSHELNEFGIKRFSFMLSIEHFCILLFHSKHFEVADGKIFLDLGDDLADVHIAVRFDHPIGFVADRFP